MKKPEEFWDKQADNYDNSEKRYELIHIKAVENTKKYLDVSDIVLEYGCGTGKKAFELAGNVKEIHAIDISSEMIKIAKRGAVERKIENVDFTKATIFDEIYKKESFNAILAFNILHVLKNNQQVIQRITELLKPGGLFISTTTCLKEKMGFLNKIQLYLYFPLIKLHLIPDMLTFFKFPELEDLITSGNLQIIETEKIFHKVSSYFIVAKKIEK